MGHLTSCGVILLFSRTAGRLDDSHVKPNDLDLEGANLTEVNGASSCSSNGFKQTPKCIFLVLN